MVKGAAVLKRLPDTELNETWKISLKQSILYVQSDSINFIETERKKNKRKAKKFSFFNQEQKEEIHSAVAARNNYFTKFDLKLRRRFDVHKNLLFDELI